MGPEGCQRGVWVRPITDPPLAAIRLPCKRWDCDHCGRRRRAEALKHLRAGYHPDQVMRLITVTFPAALELRADPASVRSVNERWRRYVQAVRRTYGGLQYAKVLEVTKAGRLHLHALSRGAYLPKCTDAGRRRHHLPTGRGSGSPCYCAGSGLRCELPGCSDRRHNAPCIQFLAHQAGMGWVEIRRVTDAGAAGAYVAKYLAKAQTRARWPRYARRYSTSRQWCPLTLAAIHRTYVEGLRARGLIGPPLDAFTWFRVPDPRPAPRAPPPDPPLPAPWLDPATGELLPIPW